MLLRKFFTRKRDGNDVLFRSLMIILYSMLIVLVIVSSRMITVMHNNIDDSIVSSGLAGALIDLDIFSEEDKLYIQMAEMQDMSMEEKKLTVDDFKFSQRLYLTLRRNCVKTVGDWYSSGLLICHLGEKSGIGVQVPVTALISIMFQKTFRKTSERFFLS